MPPLKLVKILFQREPVAENQPGCCDVFIDLLRACGLICYVACPPVPSIVTRKLAFHPPEKGMTYRIALKSDPEKRFKNIRGCRDEPVQLVVRNISNGADYIHSEKEVEVFSVTTANNNDLVCIKCTPDSYSSNPAVSDQVSIPYKYYWCYEKIEKVNLFGSFCSCCVTFTRNSSIPS